MSLRTAVTDPLHLHSFLVPTSALYLKSFGLSQTWSSVDNEEEGWEGGIVVKKAQNSPHDYFPTFWEFPRNNLERLLALCFVSGKITVWMDCQWSTFPHVLSNSTRRKNQVMQEEQKLMVEFQDYPNVLIRMLNNCIKEPHSHLVVFVMQHDVNARLDFIQVGQGPNDDGDVNDGRRKSRSGV